MIKVAGEDSEYLEFEPVALQGDKDNADGEDYACRQGIDVDATDKDGGVGEKEGEPGDDLRVVPQGVPHHRKSDDEHENEIESLRREHVRGWHVVHRVGGEEEERPAPGNSC